VCGNLQSRRKEKKERKTKKKRDDANDDDVRRKRSKRQQQQQQAHLESSIWNATPQPPLFPNTLPTPVAWVAECRLVMRGNKVERTNTNNEISHNLALANNV
jgi:hypothetical protein